MQLSLLLRDARACTLCADDLPAGPRPLLQGSTESRIVIIGQAPGAAAHQSGIPWDDRSGSRLRVWLGIDRETFYDANRVALLPIGLCYPGRGRSGDASPPPRCAPQWHPQILPALKRIELTVIVGRYAFERYLGDRFDSLTEAVSGFERLLPRHIALPHPSPRNNIWLKRNAWFERRTVPALRERVDRLIG